MTRTADMKKQETLIMSTVSIRRCHQRLIMGLTVLPLMCTAHGMLLHYTPVPKKQPQTLNLLAHAVDGRPQTVSTFIQRQNQTLNDELTHFSKQWGDSLAPAQSQGEH